MKVFVFGSNLAGRHGAGAALAARHLHGATYGQGVGFQGASYAIPTKDAQLKALPLSKIFEYVAEFLRFAREHPDWEFEVTPIGCGLAGYSPAQIAPMFRQAPDNCHLPQAFIHADPQAPIELSSRAAGEERICVSRGIAVRKLACSFPELERLIREGKLDTIERRRGRYLQRFITVASIEAYLAGRS